MKLRTLLPALADPVAPLHQGDYTIKPLAAFSIMARVHSMLRSAGIKCMFALD